MDQNRNPQFSSVREANLSRWAKEYFYQKLTDQGFVSYQDKGLSWYKVINNSIIQTVYLYSSSSSSWMLDTEMGYSCHPLFIPAPLPQRLSISGLGKNTVLMHVVRFPMPRITYLDTGITQTYSPQAGAELLDEIVFPQFEKMHTVEDAYQMHRQYNKQRIDEYLSRKSWADYNGLAACREFMDMLIYMEDWEMLKYCDRDLSPSLCWTPTERKRVDEQRAAIRDGKRDEFLEMLQKRQKRFVNRLEKKVGIHVSLDEKQFPRK